MAGTVGTQVNLLAAQPSLQIISNVPSGYASKVFIRKSNIKKVQGVKRTVLDTEGNVTGYKWIVEITLIDDSKEQLDISQVQNQVTWTVDDTGLDQAISDIAQAN